MSLLKIPQIINRRILCSSLAVILAGCSTSSGNDKDQTGQPTPQKPAPQQPTQPEPSLPQPPVPVDGPYIGFESGAVRPVVLTQDGKQVLVTNIPNHTLDIFVYDSDQRLVKQHAVRVGIEPVAVAVIGNGRQQQAWVVNHISDSISIIKFDRDIPYIARTLLVGDEPRDIVFANNKAFITTAHRGQHLSHSSLENVEGAGDPQLHTPSVPRADVWVFDINQPGSGVGGTPLKIINLFSDTPRGLAVSNDGNTVYAAAFHSGNQTSVVHESVMCHGFEDDNYGNKPCQTLDGKSSPNGLNNSMLPGGRTAPGVNKDGIPQPWTSMIVKYDQESGEWRDTKGRNFSNGIRFTLPDYDVFAINSDTLTTEREYQQLGTTLFNLAVNPKTDTLYVSNTEANNAVRFEGPGLVGGSTVQGNIARSQISLINSQHQVRRRELNRHINYDNIKTEPGIKRHSIATPTQMQVSNNGELLYVAALGSDKVAVYPTNQLEQDQYWDGTGSEFSPQQLSQNFIEVPGGPAGIELNETAQQLLTFTRFDNALVISDLNSGLELQRIKLSSPEPAATETGRDMLYSAVTGSSNGEASCSSCHIFGDTDHLSWNLGNPDTSNGVNPQPIPTFKFSELGCDFVGPNEPSCQALEIINGDGNRRTLASMKGPMFTQTLKGISTHGHMHWRGDRSVGYFGNDTEQTLDEKTSFKNFIVAYEGLLGLDIDLPDSATSANKSPDVVHLERDVDTFADFMLNIQLPPNPVRGLDNSLSTSAQVGRDFFIGSRRSDGLAFDSNKNGPETDGVNCEGCHGLDPAKGFYGTRGEAAHGGEIQMFKVPQLRNLYTRVGMFGLPDRSGFLPSHTAEHQGEQIRGFGFLHDGATDLLFNFLKGGVFDNGDLPCPDGADERHGCLFNQGPVGIQNDEMRQSLVDYLMQFDSDLAPVVGQQITINSDSGMAQQQRLQLLTERAKSPFISKILGGMSYECQLLAHGLIGSSQQRYLFNPAIDAFVQQQTTLALNDIVQLAQLEQNSLTFTCLVPGSASLFNI